jgi:heme/copper-type cytochrome/quinol oxidase subunit 2
VFNNLLLGTTIAVLLVTSILLVISLLKLRRQSAASDIDRSSSVLDFIWTLIPIAILILLLALTWQTIHQPVAPGP